jgi:DNA-binding PucR family transcriptional regulator
MGSRSAEWMAGLRSTRSVPVDTGALSEDGLVVLERFGYGGLCWSIEVADEATGAIFASMPALAAESALPSVFTRGVRSSLLREMRIADGEDLEAITDEAADVARDFVRRGLDLATLLESIRIGGAVSASAFIRGARELVESPEQRAEEIERLSQVFFGSLEQFSSQMSDAYKLESKQWLVTKSAERLGVVNSLLSGRSNGRRSASDLLKYDLDAHHVAVVAWSDEADMEAQATLARVVSEELRAFRAARSIVIPVGLSATWGWGSVSEGAVPAGAPVPPAGISVATGQAHPGVAGFRRSHREAKDVEHLLRFAAPSIPRSLRHADVELAVLLSVNIENAQHFVRRQLGRLAIDDERTDILRSTLWYYLTNERSVATVAGIQFVARNTVTYRVKQAEQLIGRQIDDARLEVQTALLLTRVLGDRVLVRD